MRENWCSGMEVDGDFGGGGWEMGGEGVRGGGGGTDWMDPEFLQLSRKQQNLHIFKVRILCFIET